MSSLKVAKLKGFRDFYGDDLRHRLEIMNVIREIFESYGYSPLETPTLEYYDMLTDKYGEDEKLIYNFEDFGNRHVALRYDLTVPTLRFYLENQNKIKLPWRRYQIQPVWRADTPQRGRFREFYQCDADIIGSASLIPEIEYISMGIEILNKLGLADFTIQLNNRKIIDAIATYMGSEDHFTDIVLVLDKWKKRKVEDSLRDLKLRLFDDETPNKEQNKIVDKFLKCVEAKNIDELRHIIGGSTVADEGLDELEFIMENVNSEHIKFDTTIARGLSYYTGPIWEWIVAESDIGSVGGGGRYDDMIGSFTGRSIPATGGSFGIERLFNVLRTSTLKSTIPKVLVTIFDKKYIKNSLRIADMLRESGVNVELYAGISHIKKQFEYANANHFNFVIIIGEEEIKSGKLSLKDMSNGDQSLLTINQVIKKFKS